MVGLCNECMHTSSLSRVQLFVTAWLAACHVLKNGYYLDIGERVKWPGKAQDNFAGLL